jgi:hypothetical protein
LPVSLGGEIQDVAKYILPWTDYANYCVEKGRLWHHESMVVSDPTQVIRKNPLDRVQIEAWLAKVAGQKAALKLVGANKSPAGNGERVAATVP